MLPALLLAFAALAPIGEQFAPGASEPQLSITVELLTGEARVADRSGVRRLEGAAYERMTCTGYLLLDVPRASSVRLATTGGASVDITGPSSLEWSVWRGVEQLVFHDLTEVRLHALGQPLRVEHLGWAFELTEGSASLYRQRADEVDVALHAAKKFALRGGQGPTWHVRSGVRLRVRAGDQAPRM